MATVFESHLELLERECDTPLDAPTAERARGVEDLVALHAAVYPLLERRISGGGLAEADRPLVPLFCRWLQTARHLVAVAGGLRAEGQTVQGVDDLLRAINRAKLPAEHFDEVVGLNGRTARGEAGAYRPLREVVDELRPRP